MFARDGVSKGTYLHVSRLEDLKSVLSFTGVHDVDRYILDVFQTLKGVPAMKADESPVRAELLKIMPARVHAMMRMGVIKADLSVDQELLKSRIERKKTLRLSL